MDISSVGTAAASFLASGVEFVEALTIVLALGVTRGWRSSLWGAASAFVLLVVLVVAIGPSLTQHVCREWLQLIVGVLLLIFGLQWLRKAILRSTGFKALHDEDEAFAEETEAARRAPAEQRFGLDWYAFTICFKGVLLEGLEVVFIVIGFGASAGAIARRRWWVPRGVRDRARRRGRRPPPALARAREPIKHGVGLALSTFGLFWLVEGLNAVARTVTPSSGRAATSRYP